MSSDAEMIARHERMLAGLAERAYALACDLQQQALSADSPEEKAQLARAFHDVGRSMRQALALELRLRRESRELERENAAEAEGVDVTRRSQARRAEVRARLRRLIWTEYDSSDAAELEEDLELKLDAIGRRESFLTDPLDHVIARLKADLDIEGVEPPSPEGTGVPWPDDGASTCHPEPASPGESRRSSA